MLPTGQPANLAYTFFRQHTLEHDHEVAKPEVSDVTFSSTQN